MSADTSGAGSGERRERQAAGGSCQRWLRCLDGRPPLARIFDVAVLPAAAPIASLRTRREDARCLTSCPGNYVW
jgi:hypothetical protein